MMGGERSTFKILGLLAVAGLILPGTPFVLADEHEAPAPVEGGGHGTGWVAVNLTLNGSPVTLTYEATDVEEPFIRGKGVYDGQHDLFWHLLGTQGVPGGPMVYGDIDAVDGENTTLHEEQEFTGDATYELTPRYETGTLNLFMWMAGEAANWSYSLEGEDYEVNGVTQGNDTFYFGPEDFQAPLNIHASPAVGARLDASASVQIETSLIGWFSSAWGQQTHTDFRTETPGGTESCSCSFVHFQGTWAPGPGEYTFHANGASLSSYHAGGVLGAHLPK